MHRIDGTGHVAGMFTEGDPLVPTAPTQITDDWLNAVQEEIVNVIATSATLVKADNTQLLNAIKRMIPKAWRVDVCLANVTTLADFTSSVADKYHIGSHLTMNGEVMHSNHLDSANTMLFSMVVNVSTPSSVSFVACASDDETYLYIDGTLAYTFTSSTGFVLQTHSASLAAGNHVIQLLHNNSGGTKSDLILGAFIDGTIVTYLRADVV